MFFLRKGVLSFLLLFMIFVGGVSPVTSMAAYDHDSEEVSAAAMADQEEEERDWQFTWFGTSTNQANNTMSGNITDGLQLASSNGKGKFTSDGYDGMAFYYTKINPQEENFELKAKIQVDNLVISNGQEGFALLVRDSLGTHGDNRGAYYSNSVATMATKVDYNNENGEKVTLRLGIGSRIVKGITATNQAPAAGSFSNTMTSLDTSIQQAGEGRLINQGDHYTFILKKTNTGYHTIYQNAEGEEVENIFYEPEALEVIDSDFVYVGIAVARNCKVTVEEMSFTTSDPNTDPPGEERPLSEVEPHYEIASPKTFGMSNYTLIFKGNADGLLTMKDQKGNFIIDNQLIGAHEEITRQVELVRGSNQFQTIFIPDPDYRPSEFEKLTSHDPADFTTMVTYKNYGNSGQTIVVSPSGGVSGAGTHASPLDLQTALNFVQPGQTILMKSGIYKINKGLKVPRGINGTEETPIYLVSDPGGQSRAIIDFLHIGTGFEIWGDHWYVKGIDIRNSANMSKGLQLSGSYNTLDQVNAYNNGNTGIQVSGLAAETIERWPAHNLILNCTSYNNSDEGMEDADGFAAKLTCGAGNVFRGCIAYNNADDGWDLFAKVATGTIGAVTIENSVTYRNGYLLDGTAAGNGNGFKMGGSGLPGGHILVNSISFENKAKGIDSNSCPDIIVKNSISYNNESYNVALYSNSGVTTNFRADGIISYKSEAGIREQLVLQELSCVDSSSNYFFNGEISLNTENEAVSSDWFEHLDTNILPIRKEDGSIDMRGLLTVTGEAPEMSGARLEATPSPVLVVPPAIIGHVSQGGKGDSSSSGITKPAVQTFLASNGDMGQWKRNETGWWLENSDRSYAKTEWKQVGGKWYFFNEQGYMATGWHILDQNQWHYMDESGAMLTGWVFYREGWYYLNPNGTMTISHVDYNNKRYVFDSTGKCENP